MGSSKDLDVPVMTQSTLQKKRETRPKETVELELASEKEIQGVIKRETD